MVRGRFLWSILALGALAGLSFVAYAWELELAPIEPSQLGKFDPTEIKKGATLAAIGNCGSCHTRPGGATNGGGRALETPFGTIHSTNITPDADTGIGRWSFEAFARAMHKGVDRAGRHLYPAFPYDHFTLVSEADNRALYAFLMTRAPINAPALENNLTFPLNERLLIAGWKLLNLKQEEFRLDPSKDGDWNRGAYLAEGLGHCGACHTPRNAIGGERRDRHFDGGDVEGWVAYAINEQSPAPVPWTVDSLHFYLRNGWHTEHGISRGPMAPVTANLGEVSDGDVRAIAVYVADRMADRMGARDASSAQSKRVADDSQAAVGRPIFDAACASCHDGSRPLPFGGIDLRLSSAVHAPDPTNIINVALHGLPPAPGERSPIMPSYGAVISEAQIVDLLTYMRSAFTDKPAWAGLPELVAKQRARGDTLPMYSSDGNLSAPARPNERVTAW
jgi:mono/diheme cytochrome c family protein